MKRLTLFTTLIVILTACSSAAPAASNAPVAVASPTVSATAKPTPSPTATPDPTATPLPTPVPTPVPTPKPITYSKLTARNFAKLMKAPDSYMGNGYVVWACISQFDAATGLDSFRGQVSWRNEKYFYSDGVNAFFGGDQAQLADFVQDDIVVMNVIAMGSYSYDTQNGGNTTAPLFDITKITIAKGSCA